MRKILLPILMLLFLSSLSLFWEKGSVGLNFGSTRANKEIAFSWRDEKIKEDGETYLKSVTLGLQGQAMKNLGIFGEIGFGYTLGKFNRRNGAETNTDSQRWGFANTGVGIIFYF